MTVWVLIVWAGVHQGHYTVPGIASEIECHRLAKAISESKVGDYVVRSLYACVSYTQAR